MVTWYLELSSDFKTTHKSLAAPATAGSDIPSGLRDKVQGWFSSNVKANVYNFR